MRDYSVLNGMIENQKSELRTAYDKGYNQGVKDIDFQLAISKRQDEAYKQGLHDAWACCKRFLNSDDKVCDKIFGVSGWADFLDQSPSEAIEKFKEYDEKHFDVPESMRGEINIGDEVKITEQGGIFRAIVIQRDNTKYPYTIMYDNGDTQHVVEGSLEKTGRHFDAFENLLKQMRNDE